MCHPTQIQKLKVLHKKEQFLYSPGVIYSWNGALAKMSMSICQTWDITHNYQLFSFLFQKSTRAS